MPGPGAEPESVASAARRVSAHSPRLPAWLAAACWLLLGAVLVRLGSAAMDQLRAPFDLVYESPNLSTIEVLRAGGNPYSPDVFDAAPFVLTIYTPLYHLVVAALPAVDGHPFLVGRIVALLSMLGAAMLLFAARAEASGSRGLAVAALAAAAFLALWPVSLNAAFLKNDPLALLCAAGAVVLVARGTARLRAGAVPGESPPAPQATLPVLAPAVLCVAAVMAKQTYVAASAACALHLLLAHPRSGRRFLLVLAACGAASALVASAVWGDGFWFCTLSAARHPLSLDTASAVLGFLARQPLLWVVTACAAAGLAAVMSTRGRAALSRSPFPLYLLASCVVFAATVGKRGATTNYAFEPCLAALLWICSADDAAARSTWRPVGVAAITGLLALLLATGLDLASAKRGEWCLVDGADSAARLATAADLRERCTRLAGPDAVVLDLFGFRHNFELLPADAAERGGVLRSAGLLNDPWLYSILWEQGTLKPGPLAKALKRGVADIVLLPEALDPRQPIAGPAGQVLAAVASRFRLAESGAGYAFWVRAPR